MPRGIPSKMPGRQSRKIGGDLRIDIPQYKMYHNAKHRAKKKGIKFEIEMEDIIIPTTCPLLGIPIRLDTGDKRSPNNPSLDQIRPGKGYTLDNIQVISARANWLKADATLQELKTLVENLEAL
jgi:hypothetical protein